MVADVLVIGSGISGLSYAIKLASRNPSCAIVLISKDQLKEGNTRYAQGGIAVVSNFEKDSFEKHVKDTLIAGDELCNEEVVQFVVKEGYDRLEELIAWGTQFDTKANVLHLAKEGGHSEKRIVHYKDKTGSQIQEALIRKVKAFKNIKLFENHVLVDLITDHHTKTNHHRCYGAYVISKTQQEIIKISAKVTVLSTGGAGSLYAHTTNPEGATGDGLGAAYRAKVFMEALPYVQFHPTALLPKIDGNTFLITEAVRGAGGQLVNENNDRFMPRYDQRAELAPRDIVARAIQLEIQQSQSNHVFLDCSSISEAKWLERFPNIYKTCKKIGIQLPKDPIPIVPAAHYFCGGIKVDSNSESQLNGLFAVGECSATGLHGANRLASNSLLESVVFSHRAALATEENLKGALPQDNFYKNLPDWKGEKDISTNKIKAIALLRNRLKQTMTDNVGIFKTKKGLKKADNLLEEIYNEMQLIYHENKLTPELSELRNMVSVSHLLIKQSLQIKENRGVFYNLDNEN